MWAVVMERVLFLKSQGRGLEINRLLTLQILQVYYMVLKCLQTLEFQ